MNRSDNSTIELLADSLQKIDLCSTSMSSSAWPNTTIGVGTFTAAIPAKEKSKKEPAKPCKLEEIDEPKITRRISSTGRVTYTDSVMVEAVWGGGLTCVDTHGDFICPPRCRGTRMEEVISVKAG